jgi:GAF domain-containing protein/anti-sigma regulatory factor (Ser/Thr protein kinase)
MVRSGEDPGDAGFCFARLAAAVVDQDGIVVGWSAEAAALLELPGSAVSGRPFRNLLADMTQRSQARNVPAGGLVELRRGATGRVRAALYGLALQGGDGPRTLLLFAPAETAAEWRHAVSLLRALLQQDAMGLGIHGSDLRLEITNVTPATFGGPPIRPGERVHEVLTEEYAVEFEAILLRAMRTGVPVLAHRQSVRARRAGHREWVLSVSAFRLEDADGLPTGVAAMVDDVSEQERIRRQRDLLHQAATRIGFSLDVHRTSQELAEVVTNGFADLATVDINPSVLMGDDPPRTAERPGGARLLRVAATGSTEPWPAPLLQVGSIYPQLPGSSEVRDIQRGEPVVLDRQAALQALGDEALVRLLVPEQATSLVVSPLYARGHLLGTVTGWRTGASDPFDAAESELLSDIASRAALGIDNARRYTREHRAAVSLQERLLPHAQTDLPAAQTAGVHRTSGGGTEVSGDWFDVIDLPSLRVAFVVGDVIGHGLGAAATMGRLRTAVQTFAGLELDPGELLAHVEDLVQRLANETPARERDAVGATCLYAVYDPTTCRCTLASAGHPPPVMVGPDGSATVLDVPPNPPLSAGAELFQSVTVDVAPGSVIALYTDGLLALERYRGARDVQRLRDELAVHCRRHIALDDLGESLVADAAKAADAAGTGAGGSGARSVRRARQRDDIALLLARTRTVSSDDVSSWQFPADLASVAAARTAVTGKLADWDLDELAFSTELVVSELTTNAIRYAGGPVTLRLIRGDVLICEVTDPSNTQPRVVKAGATDEGGRGLFIVAQCTSRWGCRYGQQGKTIWTEQPLPTAHASRSRQPSGV